MTSFTGPTLSDTYTSQYLQNATKMFSTHSQRASHRPSNSSLTHALNRHIKIQLFSHLLLHLLLLLLVHQLCQQIIVSLEHKHNKSLEI